MAERMDPAPRLRAAGSQPVLHDSATIDALTGMVIALLGEVVVLRDRIDAGEILSERQGGFGAADIDGFAPDAAARAARARRRTATYDRVLGIVPDRLLPQTLTQHQDYDRIVQDAERP